MKKEFIVRKWQIKVNAAIGAIAEEVYLIIGPYSLVVWKTASKNESHLREGDGYEKEYLVSINFKYSGNICGMYQERSNKGRNSF